jgi:hypothetical protein
MSLDESGRGRGEPLGIRERDVGRIPTRAGADAPRVLQGREELMSQEGIAISPKRVPLLRIDLVDAVVDVGPWRRLCQE